MMDLLKVMMFLLLGWSLALQAQDKGDVQTLSAQELTQRLPADADLTRMDAQRRALNKGFYWTQDHGIRPLPKAKSSS